ncbi:MAG: hypothetical protein ChlgKO_08550 [Chlamydiales bacterium]
MNITWNNSIVGSDPLHKALDASQKAVAGKSWTPQVVTNLTNAFIDNPAVAAVSNFSYRYFFSYFQPLFDYIAPISGINGHRTFSLIPLFLEKFLGEYIFYPSATSGMTKTQKYKETVEGVYNKLKADNAELLNAKTEENPDGYNYQVNVVRSNTVNAFACPAGGMVVYSGIVSELKEALKTTKSADVTLRDGSKIQVDLSDVTLDDALAALMGHEMTHVASRHGMGKMFANLTFFGLFKGISYFAISHLKKNNEEYQKLQAEQRKSNKVTERINEIERSYERINYIADHIFSILRKLLSLHHSRSCEYEADVAGIHLANKSGYNPLGAIFLEQVLTDLSIGAIKPEILRTHPLGEHRKLSALAAIDQIAPNQLNGKITVRSEAAATSPFFKHLKQKYFPT